jgi:hypothetical protein
MEDGRQGLAELLETRISTLALLVREILFIYNRNARKQPTNEISKHNLASDFSKILMELGL